MAANPLSAYKQVQIRTLEGPGDILVAMFDGLFRFLHQARHALSGGPAKRPEASEALSRAYAIVLELNATLDRAAFPELCDRLAGLYDFCLSRLMHANRNSHAPSVEEVVRVLTPVREAFTTVVRQEAAKAAQTAKAAGGGG